MRLWLIGSVWALSLSNLTHNTVGFPAVSPYYEAITGLGRMTTIMSIASGEPRLLMSFMDRLDGRSVKLVLASQSPRRREILDMMGLSGRYTAQPSPLDETALQEELLTRDPPLTSQEYTETLAQKKAEALAKAEWEAQTDTTSCTTFYLGSDTIVEFDGKILEKPKDEMDAKRMLKVLSGQTHYVHTGVSIIQNGPKNGPMIVSKFVDTAQVTFSALSQSDIDSYVGTKEPMDKAGSYGIQGIGGQMVARLTGDFFTVMGLPMHRTSVALATAISNIQSGSEGFS